MLNVHGQIFLPYYELILFNWLWIFTAEGSSRADERLENRFEQQGKRNDRKTQRESQRLLAENFG